MKRYTLVLPVLAVIFMLAGAAQAQSKAAPAFDKLKALAGEWQGKSSDGADGAVTYRIASGGAAVIETLKPKDEPEMITVYHHDGNSLVMTHYCSAGNQPRMRAEVPTGEIKRLEFKFIDATNLKNPTDGHIHNLVVEFKDKDHITTTWTWREKGQDTSLTLNLERKK